MEKLKDAVLIPCGHADTCMDCARHIASERAKCPICRADITEAKQFGREYRKPDGTVVMTSPGGFTVA